MIWSWFENVKDTHNPNYDKCSSEQEKLYELIIFSLFLFLKTVRDVIRFSSNGRLFQFLGNE